MASNLLLHPGSLAIRSSTTSSNSTNLCVEIEGGNIVISKRTLIIAAVLCVFLTGISILATTALLYREWSRRQQAKAAKAWGRSSRFEHRISLMRKEVDASYSKQFSGCLQNEPENPEMGSDSPVELMIPERLCEAPAIPAQTANSNRRKHKAISLFFDQGLGIWMPKR